MATSLSSNSGEIMSEQYTTEPDLGMIDDESSDDETTSKADDTESKTSDQKRTQQESEPKQMSEEEKKESAFECNICLDVASDAVISMCGHLFCWPCLHQWLETRPHHQICPVCKAGIGRDKVVPLYGRGNSEPKDPRDKPIPPRPRGQRPEPETNGTQQGPGFWGLGNGPAGFQMSFGIGAFPFGFFATNFNMGEGFLGASNAPVGSAQFEEERFLSKAFLWVAFAFIFWLLIA